MLATVILLAISRLVLWPYVAAVVAFVVASATTWPDVTKARGSEKIVALNRLFIAVPLAIFGTEHLGAANFIAPQIPAWIPWHLFWAYFVGLALLAASLSIAARVLTRWSGTLLGLMILIFVLTIHIPRVMANPHDRFAWAVAVRDLSFAGGAWALSRTRLSPGRGPGGHPLITLGRIIISAVAIFFAVEHFMHPQHLPGVPLEKLTPEWIPARLAIGYLTGAFLLIAGVLILIGRKARAAATYLGAEISVLVVFIYVPLLFAVASNPNLGVKIEGMNYFGDTLLYSGCILALANALPKDERLA
jgi:uncharacterized membrane protein YphA (DoxX/SURF4 family)